MDATAALAALLHADGPDRDRVGDLALFGRLVGHWSLTWTGARADGPADHAVGDLAVSWVLGGRAVQDVWAAPGPGEAGCGSAPRAFYGTTLRMPAGDGRTWRSLWFDPVGGRVRLFAGVPHHLGCRLTSTDAGPWLRWTFSHLGGPADCPLAFRWTGEQSHDAGASWQLDDVMEAERR